MQASRRFAKLGMAMAAQGRRMGHYVASQHKGVPDDGGSSGDGGNKERMQVQFSRTYQLRLEEGEMFVVGMSLGFADQSRIENTLVPERAKVGAFTELYAD
jgi:hypothetical protein